MARLKPIEEAEPLPLRPDGWYTTGCDCGATYFGTSDECSEWMSNHQCPIPASQRPPSVTPV